MKIFILIVIGLVGGVIGGMGMGGGTLLIPLLTIFSGLNQHTAQALNLIAFVPMSIVALIIHLKNKLVDFRQVLWIAVPATALGVLSAWVSKLIGAKQLSVYFGIFLFVLGIYQLICAIVTIVKNKKKKAAEKAAQRNAE